MGSWGTGIFEGDSPLDVKAVWDRAWEESDGHAGYATAEVLKANSDMLDDPRWAGYVWIPLAALQLAADVLEERVRDQAIASIPYDLEEWVYGTDPGDPSVEERRIVLDDLRSRLEGARVRADADIPRDPHLLTTLERAYEEGRFDDAAGLLESADHRGLALFLRRLLGRALESRQREWASLFVRAGADMDSVDDMGETLLHVLAAAPPDDPVPIRLLLDMGATVSPRSHTGATPLHLAALSGHRRIALALLSAGADPTATLYTGETPATLALSLGHTRLYEQLRTAGDASAGPRERLLDHPDPQDYSPSVPLEPTDERYLRCAITLAEVARERGDHPFGALLVEADGTVLHEAENTVVTQGDITRHAELSLVQLAVTAGGGHDLRACTLYTSTEPCAMCAGAIFWAGIGRVVYALGHEALAEVAAGPGDEWLLALSCREVFARGSHAVEVSGPHLVEEARAVHLGYWG